MHVPRVKTCKTSACAVRNLILSPIQSHNTMEDTQQASSDVTSQVYCAIRDGLFSDAIITLQSEVQVRAIRDGNMHYIIISTTALP